MRLAPEVRTRVDLAVLVESGRQHEVELAARIDDVPGLHRIIPIVFPTQLVADLREPAVDDHAVLGEPRTGGPLRAELQPDDVTAAATRAAAPVPVDARRPAASTDVEHTPRVAGGRTADRAGALADAERPGRRARLVFRRVVEQILAPRDDDVERLVTGRQ